MHDNHNSRRRRLAPEDRRSELLAAAERVLTEHGFVGSTVQRIVNEAGVARGSFYRYFDSRDHIYGELIGQVTEPLEELVLRMQFDDIQTRQDLERAVLPFYRELADQLLMRPGILREALLAAPGRRGVFGQRTAAFLDALRSVGEGFIVKYCGRAPFRGMALPRVSSAALVGMVVGAALAAIESEEGFEPEAWAREIARMEAAVFADGPQSDVAR